VTGVLKVHENHDRHQAADVEAASGGVEADVGRHRAFGERARDPLCVLGHKPTPLKLFEHAIRLHGTKIDLAVSNCQAMGAMHALVRPAHAR
jgi:hypothetical protein